MSDPELGHGGDGEDHQVAALLRRVGEDLVDGEWHRQLGGGSAGGQGSPEGRPPPVAQSVSSVLAC